MPAEALVKVANFKQLCSKNRIFMPFIIFAEVVQQKVKNNMDRCHLFMKVSAMIDQKLPYILTK